jgi:hypothetical protein
MLFRQAGGVAYGERSRLHRGVDRAPYIDDRKAALEQVVRLGGQEVAHALGPGVVGVVVVGEAHGQLGLVFAALGQHLRAQVVVECEYATGTHVLADERLDLGIVGDAQIGVVVEVLDPASLLHQLDAMHIQREIPQRTGIVDRHHLRPKRGPRARVSGAPRTNVECRLQDRKRIDIVECGIDTSHHAVAR